MQLNRQAQVYNNTTLSGSPTAITGINNLSQSNLPLVVLVVTVGGVSGTSPTLKFQLMTSIDNVNYANDGAQTTQITAVGTYRFNLGSDVLEPFLGLLPVLGGTTPSFTGVTATLLMTSPDS